MEATQNDAKITFYSGNYCPYCVRVRKELDRLDLSYETVNADDDGRSGILQISGQRAIPVVTIDDEVLVDSTHIIRELRKRYV